MITVNPIEFSLDVEGMTQLGVGDEKMVYLVWSFFWASSCVEFTMAAKKGAWCS